MIDEKVKNIKWKKDEDGIEFERIEIDLRHDMTAKLDVTLCNDGDRLYSSSESAWVFIDYKGEEYDLTEYEISEGYPYQEDYTETSNSKLPRHRDGDYHSSWFKKLKENTDYLIKKADEIYGF
jgi:hypothetical protein